MSGPYGAAAGAYAAADWSPLPLPPRQKWAPPTGWTGAAGKVAGPRQVERWMPEHAGGNVALRLPDALVGIDVDAYGKKAGAATLAELERELGPLPATWIVTNRDDGVSGIRLYQVPDGLGWKGAAGPGIDIITWYHRFIVAPPSIHPEGRKYRWIRPDGTACDVKAFCKALEDYAVLPDAWVDYLTSDRRKFIDRPAAEMSKADTKAAIAACPDAGGQPCSQMRWALDLWLRKLAEAGADGGAHDVARDAAWAVILDGRKGHRGVTTTLDAIREAFFSATADRRRDEAEWGRIVDRGVAKAVEEVKSISSADGCDADAETERLIEQAKEPSEDAVDAMLAELLDFDALDAIPEAEYLIKGLFDMDSLAQVFGQSGHRKSFVMLDISCHISLGLPWGGRRVRSGPVVYIAAEGERGVRKRLRAWAQHHGKRPNVLVLPRPVSADEWPVLVAALKRVKPVLVVGDTQARLTSGIDENSAKEIGPFIDRLDDVRRATGACVAVVHHEGLAVGRARGSSAQKGALEHQFRVFTDKETQQTVFTDEKQKDNATSGDLRFDPVVVSLGKDADGDPITSLVLVPAADDLLSELDRLEDIKSKYQRKIIEIISDAPFAGMTKAEVRSVFTQSCDRQRFAAAWDAVIQRGLIVPVGKSARYRLAGIEGG
ncbi:AAA family ATPase [Micromonospora sp. NPDC005257]|uniref:AAA family ATPase n=1 Tax=Micromonospora sp. NPDC005257 TaxID=3364230 RepID=UPI00369FA167